MSEERGGQRIRQAFERSLEPPSDGFASRMRTAVTAPPAARGPRRWPLEVAAAVLAIVAVVALTVPHLLVGTAPVVVPTPSEQPGVVAWADLPAPNVAQPFTEPGVRACRASDLNIGLSSIYVGSGPLNTSTWTISVKNTGPQLCFVGPTMDITFRTAEGPLKMNPLRWGGDIVYLVPGGLPALGEVDTFPCALPPVTGMSISPGPSLGSIDVTPGLAGGVGTPCPNEHQSYLLELYADQNQVGYASMISSAMSAPAVGHPGQHLRFLVTLTNRRVAHHSIAGTVDPTPSPLSFAPCPTYHLELEGVEGTFHTYELNCAQAAIIGPNGSETFEMFIDVPRDAQPGPATLVWSIDGSPQQWQRASAYVAIET